MNVLIAALVDFKPMLGGIAEYTHQLATHMLLLGHDVSVVSSELNGCREFDRKTQYPIVRINLKRHRFLRPIRIFDLLVRSARRGNADLLVCNLLDGYAPISCLAARYLGIPFILWTYGKELGGFEGTWLQRYLRKATVRHASIVVGCSNWTCDQVKEIYGIPPTRLRVVWPGVDPRLEEAVSFSERASEAVSLIARGRRLVLTVGRLVERKGVDYAIRAMRLVRERIPEVLLIVAGDGPYRSRLEEIVKSEQVDDHVFFAGRVSPESKLALFALSEVFLMPNRELAGRDAEGFGIVFIEAGAFRKPVIGGRSGGTIEAIEHGVTGFLVEPESVTDISTAVLRCLEDPDLSKCLGENGYRRVQQDFTWNAQAEHLVDALRPLIAQIAAKSAFRKPDNEAGRDASSARTSEN